MKIEELNKKYDRMQKKYGDKNLSSIYNGGCEDNPDICFVFMNPTGRNVASEQSWKGRRSPWIGTKNIWKLFYQIGILDEEIYKEIQNKRAKDWNEEFADKVYEEVTNKRYFITNLGKCTQVDARPLPDSVLKEKISVSEWRKQKTKIKIKKEEYEVYPVYYPVGNGMRNIDLVIEDLKYILGE